MNQQQKIATVTLNPAIDQTISIPGFRAGRVNRVQHWQSDPGGKGVNVASILADLGFPVTVTGFLGKDNPSLFEKLFQEKKIEDRFVRISGSTRIGIKVVDPENQETTDINFPGEAPTTDDVRSLFQIVEELSAECAWFVLSGSIPPGVSADIYRDLIDVIHSQGKKTALDTSGEALRRALRAVPALVKPNREELQECLGRSMNSQDALIDAGRGLMERGIETVIVSMGGQGALFADQSDLVLAKPPSVAVKSTVGAGDSMLSGMVAGRIRGLPLADCARLATAFALGAITRVGSGIPSPEKIQEFMERVSIEKLDQ